MGMLTAAPHFSFISFLASGHSPCQPVPHLYNQQPNSFSLASSPLLPLLTCSLLSGAPQRHDLRMPALHFVSPSPPFPTCPFRHVLCSFYHSFASLLYKFTAETWSLGGTPPPHTPRP